MNHQLQELVFILDKSGSMHRITRPIIDGYNEMLQKYQNKKIIVSTILFNQEKEILHNRLFIDEIPKITEEDYIAKGQTALFDTIGDTLRHISKFHKMTVEPQKTVCIIATDGIDNVSHLYSKKRIKAMINYQKKKHHWEFIFFGTEIDTIENAIEIGISHAHNFTKDEKGIQELYQTVYQNID